MQPTPRFVLLLLDLLYKSHFDLGVVKLGLKTYYRACTAGLGVTLGHHTGTDCGHLGTVLRTHDGGHKIASKCRTGHHQLLVLGYLQLGAVSGKAGCQTGRKPGCQVTSDSSGSEKHYVGANRIDNLGNSLSVFLSYIVLQLGMVSHYHLVRSVLEQSLDQGLYIVAGEDGHHLLSEGIGQVTCLSYKLESDRLNNTASLLREHIYVLIITFIIHIAQIYGVR